MDPHEYGIQDPPGIFQGACHPIPLLYWRWSEQGELCCQALSQTLGQMVQVEKDATCYPSDRKSSSEYKDRNEYFVRGLGVKAPIHKFSYRKVVLSNTCRYDYKISNNEITAWMKKAAQEITKEAFQQTKASRMLIGASCVIGDLDIWSAEDSGITVGWQWDPVEEKGTNHVKIHGVVAVRCLAFVFEKQDHLSSQWKLSTPLVVDSWDDTQLQNVWQYICNTERCGQGLFQLFGWCKRPKLPGYLRILHTFETEEDTGPYLGGASSAHSISKAE